MSFCGNLQIADSRKSVWLNALVSYDFASLPLEIDRFLVFEHFLGLCNSSVLGVSFDFSYGIHMCWYNAEAGQASLLFSPYLSLSLSLSSPFLSLRFSFSCSLYIFLYAGAMVHAYMLVSWCKTHLNLESVTLVAMVHAYMLVSWYTTHLNLESVTLGYLQYSVTPMLLKWCYLQYLVISMLPKSCYLQYLAISMLLLRCLSSQ